ncbi:MAG: hypothetical protein KC535_02735 [Nanoarchaeota archaeon]|nr:hypothetical protein [Nanoarchaeota archaeon]
MKATIAVPYKDIEELFSCEDKELSNKRASYIMKETPDGFEFSIDATDAVALRAMLTGITKTLTVYEKMKHICQEETEGRDEDQ